MENIEGMLSQLIPMVRNMRTEQVEMNEEITGIKQVRVEVREKHTEISTLTD